MVPEDPRRLSIEALSVERLIIIDMTRGRVYQAPCLGGPRVVGAKPEVKTECIESSLEFIFFALRLDDSGGYHLA